MPVTEARIFFFQISRFSKVILPDLVAVKSYYAYNLAVSHKISEKILLDNEIVKLAE